MACNVYYALLPATCPGCSNRLRCLLLRRLTNTICPNLFSFQKFVTHSGPGGERVQNQNPTESNYRTPELSNLSPYRFQLQFNTHHKVSTTNIFSAPQFRPTRTICTLSQTPILPELLFRSTNIHPTTAYKSNPSVDPSFPPTSKPFSASTSQHSLD